MATKNANTSKVKSKPPEKSTVKAAAKPKEYPKGKGSVKVVAKTLPKTAPVLAEVKPGGRARPKIMSAIGKETPEDPPKKAAKGKAVPVEAGDKSDPEWVQLCKLNQAAKPVNYSMADDYQPKMVINHKVLGLGFVLKSQNNRIEVQFKDGKKTLITNYKK